MFPDSKQGFQRIKPHLHQFTVSGAQLVLTNLASLDGAVTVKADGTSSRVDLARLTSATGTSVWVASFTAQSGGQVLLPALAAAQYTSFSLGTNSGMSLPALTNLDNGSLYVSGGSVLSLPGLQSYWKSGSPYVTAVWQASGAGSAIVFPALTNIVAAWAYDLSIKALAGGQVVLTNLTTLDGAVTVNADGAGSRMDLAGLTSMPITASSRPSFTAQNKGFIDLRRVQSISGYGCGVISDGTGSVIDLSSLSSFATPLGVSELTAKNGGVILLPGNVFLLVNVAVNVPGYLVTSPGAAVSLYGRAWHSYWVEWRDTRGSANAWQFWQRVPQTNDLQVISGPPKSWQAFRVWEFVADPAIVDLNRINKTNVQLVLYGAPPKSFEVQTVTNLNTLPGGWVPSGLSTGPMTNSFRLFPPFTPPAEPQRFFRAKEM